jgi:4-amino-4-deoxy-L-arabinose transferase-like glycosyltransferase
MHIMGWKHWPEMFFLFSVSIFFLVLATHNITLPGLYSDEALEPAIAMNIYHHSEKMFNFVDISGKDIFVMFFPYIGPIEVYSFLPFFYLFGVSLYVVRMAAIFWGLLEVIIFFYFAKEFFGRKLAFIATLLFATMPAVIFYSRQGAYANHIILIPFMLFFLFAHKFIREKRISFFYAAAFFFGLGFATKITFWWIILPLALSFFLLKASLRLNLWQIFAGFDFFCVGAFPFILYNIASKGGTFSYILTKSPEANYNLLANFGQRINQFISLLNGSLADFKFGTRLSTHFFYFFCIALIFMIGYSILKTEHKKINYFFIFLIFFVLLESVLTVSGLNELHLYLLLPFCILIAAEFLYKILLKSWAAFALLLVLIIFSNTFTTYHYYSALSKTGGTAQMSDAIYELSDYLEKENITRPLAVDWGFAYNIPILTDNKIKPLEIYLLPHLDPNYERNFEQICRLEFLNESNAYLFTAPGYTWMVRYPNFLKVAESMHKRIVLEKTFYERSGEPIYLIYRVT